MPGPCSGGERSWLPLRSDYIRALMIIAVGVVFAAGLAIWHPRAPHWAQFLKEGEILLADALAKVQQQPAIWVDARSAEEFAAGHIPDAVHCSEDDWDAGLMAVVARWQPGMAIIVYCDEQRCDRGSAVATRLRQETGFDGIYLLHGGWQAWKRQ